MKRQPVVVETESEKEPKAHSGMFFKGGKLGLKQLKEEKVQIWSHDHYSVCQIFPGVMIIVIFGGKCGHYYVVQTFYATFILHTFTLSGNNAQWSVELDSPTEHAGKVGRRHCRVPSTLEACVLVRVLQTRPQCRAHTHRASERTGFRDWLVLLGAAQCELLSEGGRLEAWLAVVRRCCREAGVLPRGTSVVSCTAFN